MFGKVNTSLKEVVDFKESIKKEALHVLKTSISPSDSDAIAKVNIYRKYQDYIFKAKSEEIELLTRADWFTYFKYGIGRSEILDKCIALNGLSEICKEVECINKHFITYKNTGLYKAIEKEYSEGQLHCVFIINRIKTIWKEFEAKDTVQYNTAFDTVFFPEWVDPRKNNIMKNTKINSFSF